MSATETRARLETALLEVQVQAEIRADWDWAAFWQMRRLGLAACPDHVLPGFAAELHELVDADRDARCQ